MKKMVFSLSVLLAGYTLAQVESQVVGYNTITLGSGFTMIAPAFNALDGADMSIQDFIPGTTVGLTPSNVANSADQIQVWDSASSRYVSYYLHNGSGKGNAGKAGKWVTNDSAAEIATVMISPIMGVFFNGKETTNVLVPVKGNVIPDINSVVALPPGFSMMGAPYTTDWVLNGNTINWETSTVTRSNVANSADQIQIWNPTTKAYASYYLHDGSGKGNAGKASKWVTNDSAAAVAAVTVPIGSAVFYNAKATVSLNTVAPYSL